jgi:hypothetical protein
MKLDLLGGLLQVGKRALNIDPVELAKQLATQATAQFSKPLVSGVFQGMRVEGRRTLATKLRTAADHLWAGECDAAADVTADIIDDIKL